ncbi:hypothetical protein C8R45DRAFT_1218862 [Mycena sanguinolenta]|nr:hypothetical protein C8R45DRAFT_1218862 [Mycena sanguinolenta]
MLLILSLVYLLARYRAVSGHPFGSRDEAVSCDSNVNSRSLFAILTSCLITVFACTWVSVHPNVPPPNQSKLAVIRRRLGLMLVAVIAPELMMGFAPEYVAAIQSIEKEDIEDKSKGDCLSKGVALLQGLWFIAQCLARVHQHLPLTQLEVATLAFQFVSIFIWVLWWYKPLDVQQPILIGCKPLDLQQLILLNRDVDECVGLIGQARRIMYTVVEPMLLGTFSTFDPLTATSVPAFWSTHGLKSPPARLSSTIFLEFFIGTIFGVIHGAAWHTSFPSTDEMLLWRVSSLVIIFGRHNDAFICVFGAVIIWILLLAYVVARIILCAVALTTLRALPPSAFVDVNWTTYIPHL